ncbi:hypothetical protein [Citricoccus nitrophenolicus]|uniref:hypothetical protein n=1 Tax=Citricoccus nitrophenolicus TaxID=863575 RepID=UPI0031EC927C
MAEKRYPNADLIIKHPYLKSRSQEVRAASLVLADLAYRNKNSAGIVSIDPRSLSRKLSVTTDDAHAILDILAADKRGPWAHHHRPDSGVDRPMMLRDHFVIPGGKMPSDADVLAVKAEAERTLAATRDAHEAARLRAIRRAQRQSGW